MRAPLQINSTDPDDQILTGIGQIAEAMLIPARRTQWLWTTGRLPFAFRWGKRICARRGALRDYVAQLEQAPVKDGAPLT